MLFEVVKVSGGFGVQNWNGEIICAYRNRKHAEQLAVGATAEIFGDAEYENERRDLVAAYLASRSTRRLITDAQLNLF